MSPASPTAAPMTGAQALIAALEDVGVQVIFGIPGGAVLPAYDPLFDSRKIRHILVRHEQGAGHAAQGYATSTGRVGVCMATSGPGATNLVTALGDAMMDSVPIVAITGQVSSVAIGTDAFQEADIRGITFPVTKHSYLVTDPTQIPRVVAEAFHLAATGRPGPVLIDISKDALQAVMSPPQFTYSWPPALDLPGYRLPGPVDADAVEQAATVIAQAQRPVLYVGGGVIKADAHAELAQLAQLTNAPVVTTLTARGAFPDTDPHHLGMPGMHGSVAAVTALQKADLLVALGARFDDRVTGKLSSFAPHARVIHLDIDPAEIGKNRAVDVSLVGDARAAIAALCHAVAAQPSLANLQQWWTQLNRWKQRYPLGYDQPSDGHLAPQQVIQRLGQIAGPQAFYVAGVGQHQMWAAQFIDHEQPRHWLSSGGAGTMGYCIPAAMGVQVAHPGSVVWAIDGDGCFQMTNQELATCALEGIPIKVAVINNSSLGMVRQWQTLFYDGRYSNTDLHSRRIPDFALLAKAYGCVGLRCENEQEMDEVIDQAMAVNDRPVVIDFCVSADAMVWPMVAAGASNDEIRYARDIAPDWGEDELAQQAQVEQENPHQQGKNAVLFDAQGATPAPALVTAGGAR